MPQSSLTQTSPQAVSTPISPSPSKRLVSLDVVRGITIAFMIMVNNNGGPGSWRFMNHAEWNGLTPTDLVFPTFMFVVGISIVFSTQARLAKGASRAELARHTVQRAIILILFGIVVNSFPYFHLAHMRFYGVLQRIGLCYLVVGLFYLWDQRVWTKIAAAAAALVGYWVLVRWVPVPGLGMPGHDIPFMDMNRNIVSWVDQHLFPYHLYLYAPDHNVRDPEGLLSDIPAAGTMLLGLLAGIWLRTEQALKTKAAGLLAACAGSLALGYFWSLWFPLNKNMWTSSYVLVAAGYSLAVLTLAYWAIELKGWRKGWTWPWLVFGSNAIVAYMFSELFSSFLNMLAVPAGSRLHESLPLFLFQHIFAHIPDPGWAAFAWSVTFTAVCFVPVWFLWRNKVFVKI